MNRPSLFRHGVGFAITRYSAALVWLVGVFVGQPCRAEEEPSIVVRSIKPQGGGATRVTAYGLTRDDFHWLAQIPGVRKAIPVRRHEQWAQVKDRLTKVELTGTTADFAEAHALKVTRGRFITAKDQAARQNVAVITDRVADELLPSGGLLGRHVRVGGEYFTVVGVLESGEGHAGRCVMIPLATMSAMLGDSVINTSSGRFEVERFELSDIELWLHEPRRVEQVGRIVSRVLQKSHYQDDYSIITSRHNP
jgi:hypothetical protein